MLGLKLNHLYMYKGTKMRQNSLVFFVEHQKWGLNEQVLWIRITCHTKAVSRLSSQVLLYQSLIILMLKLFSFSMDDF